MMVSRSRLLALTLALGAGPALAQQTPSAPGPATIAAADEVASTSRPRHAAAQAAGYWVLHLCTATFSSGLPQDIIDRTGSGQTARGNETKIDNTAKTVTVKFSDGFRRGRGCSSVSCCLSTDMVIATVGFGATQLSAPDPGRSVT
jgi:hypothetical protein